MDLYANSSAPAADAANGKSAALDRTITIAPVLERVVVLRSGCPSRVTEALEAAARHLPAREVVIAAATPDQRNRELLARYGASSRALEALAEALDAVRCFALHIEPITSADVTVVAPDFWLSPWKALRSADVGSHAERLVLSLPPPRLIISLEMTPDGTGVRLPAGVEEVVLHPAAVIDRLPGLLRERGLCT
jgi:hypothetical protein